MRALSTSRKALPAPSPGAASRAARPSPVATGRSRKRLLYRSVLGRAAMISDMLLLAGLVTALSAGSGTNLLEAPLLRAAPWLALPLLLVATTAKAGGYRLGHPVGALKGMLRTLAAIAGAAGLLLLCMSLTGAAPIEPFAHCTLWALILLAALQALYRIAASYLARAGWLSDNVVIVGATPTAERIVERNAAENSINILGYFDDRAGRSPQSMGDAAYLGGIDDLLEWPRLPQVDRIVITVPISAQARIRDLTNRLRTLPQEVILVLDLEGFAPEKTSLARVLDAPAAYVSGAPRRLGYEIAKRLVDVACASLIGLLTLPLLTIIAAVVKLDSSGPVFFRQKRHGFNNEVIRVWKFRTMKPDRLAEDGVIVQTLPCDPRVTRVGRFLRATSLDELPQLMNVLAGEMSLVGPRPHAIGMTTGATEVSRSVAEYAHRHRAKPGITGWAQINGSRGPAHTQEQVRERVRLDLEYLNRASIGLDLYILVMTVPSLIAGRLKER
jgi:Undecaprenyl-phosphate glucose phosphotransferase